MLINLSNHPEATWQKEQIRAANETYGEIVDLLFPNVPSNSNTEEVIELSKIYVNRVDELLKKNKDKNAVHIMGEFTFTYNFVLQMSMKGIETIVSTSERIVQKSENGVKQSTFRFVGYRNYNSKNQLYKSTN